MNKHRVAFSFLLISFYMLVCTGVNAQNSLPPAYSSAAGNYIKVFDPVKPYTSEVDIISSQRTLKEVRLSTQFFDGLGRPLQTVIKQGSLETGQLPTDMVAPVLYDEFGREQYKYLPYASTENNGTFKLNPFQQQQTFYNTQLTGQNETFYYGQTKFEASPLNRVEESFAPGNSWAGTSANNDPNLRRSVKMKYWINTAIDAVRIWNVTDVTNNFGTYASPGNYSSGQLYKSATVDEHGKQVLEFKDKEGKIILKKVQNTTVADDGTGKDYTGWLCTYYLYDDLNNLRCVIQPRGVELIASNWLLTDATILAEQCFRYEYDNRNRMILKKVPGAGEVRMVYDARDRLILTQDANLRLTNKWIFTKYDQLNRPVYTGFHIDNVNTTLAAKINDVNNSNAGLFETRNNQLDWTCYTKNQSYPANVQLSDILTVTYYDDYVWTGWRGPQYTSKNNSFDSYFATPSNSLYPYPQPLTQSNSTLGMTTGTSVAPIGHSYSLATVIFYDDKGRVIQTIADNSNANHNIGIDIITTQYNWTGQPLQTVQQHQKAGTNAQTHTVITKMDYDDLGRVSTTTKKINTDVEKITSRNEYDKLGQLKNKKLATYYNANAGLETLTYDYNIRGWLLGANRNYIKDAATNYFGFELAYDKTANIITGQNYTAAQFNGNIAGTTWKSAGDTEKRKFDYTYDAVNRLTGADFNQFTSSSFSKTAGLDFSVSNLTFDANGNILTMNQKGWKIGGSVTIDQMTYTYFTNTNKLKAVTDAITADQKLGDYTDKNTTATDYGYDKNGNLVTDLNKQMGTATGVDLTTGGAITYNHLNLPQTITVTGKGTITYTYDAGGNKLKKVTVESPSAANGNKTITTTTSYINGFIYESKTTVPANNPNNDYTDRLQFAGHEEGRIRALYNAANVLNGFAYDYFIKDHLGNIRMVLTDEVKQDPYPAVTLENTTYNNGTAISVEQQYFSVNAANVVNQSTATGIPVYQNNNGNPPWNTLNPHSNNAANSNRLYLLNATTNTNVNKNGLGFIVKVMSGDRYSIFGKSYHKKPTAGYSGTTNSIIVSELINAFAGSSVISSKGVTGSQITGQSGFPTTVNGLVGTQPGQSSGRPKAAINWILFDDQFKFVSGGFDMVGDAGSSTTGTLKSHALMQLLVNKNGYLYVYVSNESKVNVFFDNLQVVHDRGPLVEETHYYPFGLTMNGISSKAAGTTPNKYQYSSKEIQNKEFTDGSGLELYDFHARQQDPQLGRFWQIDPKCELFQHYNPYNYCFNNPMLFVDPDGMQAVYNWDDGKYYDEGKEVSFDQVQQQYQIGNYATSTSVMVAPELEADGKTVKNDYGTGALTSIVNAAIKTGGNIRVLHVKNADDAADQIEGITAKITNLFFLSHGDAKNSPHRAYFAIGSQNFHTEDIAKSSALSRIAAKLASTPGPLPSAAAVIVFACGAGGVHNGGAEMLKSLAKKLHATVYGPQGFGMGSANIFSSTPGSQAYPVRDHDPKAFSNALNNHGNWTRAYEHGATQVSQTIKNVYFDAFGRIHYSQ